MCAEFGGFPEFCRGDADRIRFNNHIVDVRAQDGRPNRIETHASKCRPGRGREPRIRVSINLQPRLWACGRPRARNPDHRPHTPPVNERHLLHPHLPPTGFSWIAVVRRRPRPSCLPHRDRPPGGGADRGSCAGVNGRPAGRPDAAGLGGRALEWAGCLPGACGPRAIRGGRRTPARDHRVGRGSGRGRAPVNVAVEPAGAVPGRRGAGGCDCPVRRVWSCHHAE